MVISGKVVPMFRVMDKSWKTIVGRDQPPHLPRIRSVQYPVLSTSTLSILLAQLPILSLTGDSLLPICPLLFPQAWTRRSASSPGRGPISVGTALRICSAALPPTRAFGEREGSKDNPFLNCRLRGSSPLLLSVLLSVSFSSFFYVLYQSGTTHMITTHLELRICSTNLVLSLFCLLSAWHSLYF